MEGARFHNVLSLSPYLELRERFPYLTHSSKSQLNSSNSESDLPNLSAFNLASEVVPRGGVGGGQAPGPPFSVYLNPFITSSVHGHTFTVMDRMVCVVGAWAQLARYSGQTSPRTRGLTPLTLTFYF